MLPKGRQTFLFLREMQTALITNRPRSSLFFVGTGVAFALPQIKRGEKREIKKKRIASSGSQYISSSVPL